MKNGTARRCGTKHMSKSKRAKHTILGALLDVLGCRKSARRCGAQRISKSKVLKTDGLGPLLEAQMSFRVAGARDCAPLTKCEGFVAIAKTMADVGHLKRIWKDAVRVAGAVQETCSSEILGSLGADFLKGVAFWSVRSSGLLR